MTSRYRSMIAGVALGGLSIFLTYHLGGLVSGDAGLLMRATKTIGIALIVPGMIAGIVARNSRDFAFHLAAVVNFLFWFGFAWLVGLFVTRLQQLRHAMADVRGTGDRPSSLGSE